MKTIVCFGDSNTWWADPSGDPRYSIHERWTGILKKELGEEYYIAEEGLCGRTTVWEDPIEEFKSGKNQLIPTIFSHAPADLIIIMLGTNDLKKRFSLPACDIAAGAGLLARTAKNSSAGPNWGNPKVLLIAPPPIFEVNHFKEMFEGGREKSLKFSEYYAVQASQINCYFLDSSTIIESSQIDGIHFEKGEHVKLGKAVAEKVKEILS